MNRFNASSMMAVGMKRFNPRRLWPWARHRARRTPRPTNLALSDSETLRAFLLGGMADSDAGVTITERTALGLSAVWRATMIVSGALAGLPLRTLRDEGDRRVRISSWVDSPGGPVGPPGSGIGGLTPYEWVETATIHLLLRGDAFGRHLYTQAGSLVGLELIPPGCVEVRWARERPGGKLYRVALEDGGVEEHDARTLTQIMGPSLDGLRGMSVISMARHGLGAAIAAERAAARLWRNGLAVQVIAVPDDDLTEEDAQAVKLDLRDRAGGWENAGEIPVLNRRVKLERLALSPEDAQFLESRQFSIQEIARWFGVPANLLMDPGAVSTWGTGVEIQNRGLARYTLMPWARRIEQRLSRLLPRGTFAEFDFAGLERSTPEQEIELLIRQYEAGLISREEFRRIRNMGPVNPDDTFFGPRQGEVAALPAPTDRELRELIGVMT